MCSVFRKSHKKFEMWEKLSTLLTKNNLLQKRYLFSVQLGHCQHLQVTNSRILTPHTKKWLSLLSNYRFSKFCQSSKLQVQPFNAISTSERLGNASLDRFLRDEKMDPEAYKKNLFKRRPVSAVLKKSIKVRRPPDLVRHYSTSVDKEVDNKPATSDRISTSPKNVLHNVFAVVAQQLNNRELKLQPSYNIIKEKNKIVSWCCTYNPKWPEPMKFVSTGKTKQEASHKAAHAALLWLKKLEKITPDGHPVMIDKREVLDINRRSLPTVTLDQNTTNHLKNVAEIYNNEFVPLLQENLDNKTKPAFEINEIQSLSDVNGNLRQKVFPVSKYLAKEKVNLPISEYKEQFIHLLRENQIIIVKGEPGCGKSTRIPQYVLESWATEGLSKGEPCRIAVTQPRRIAAMSLADRVSDERDERCGHIVGYQIRLKSNFNPNTGRILYCTTGILLKHLQSDVNLSNFTHVILDEAHERDVNTDLLLNLLRNAITKNNNLKLIVMSATVDIDLFKNYLNDAPTMHIPGFTYPVKSHFLDDINLDLGKTRKICENNESPNVMHEDVAKIIKHVHDTKDEGAILCFLPGWEDIVKVQKLIPMRGDLAVLCLHSRLQDSDQRKIFSRTPPGVRKVILSTNIAETSVTIDDVVYVVDTGIHKENRFDNAKGVTCIDNYWISQSSMTQRRGRAGRVRPGESFHLYTKSKYDSFSPFTDPEILKTSLTKIVLNSKVYSNNMDALEFMSQLPSPPEKNTTRRAVRELKDLQLLDENENLTSLGRVLANFQLEPKLAKVLVNAVVFKCVTPVVDIVTIFSSNTELFSTSLVDKDTIKQIKTKGSKHSDHLAMMRLFEAWLQLMEERDASAAERYCYDAKLVHHKLVTLNKLRDIHFDYLHNGLHDSLPIADNFSDNDELVKAILFSGVGTLLRHRNFDIVKGRCKKSNVFLTSYNHKASITSESVNFKKTAFPSNFLVYFNEIQSNIRRITLVRECSVIAPIAVLLFSDKPLVTKEVETNDKVLLSLKDTKIEIQCSKEEAEHIIKCKEAIDSAYSYFIFQMTEGGECNSRINAIWDKILNHINSILEKHSIK
ncbi:ATP-dependent RNA helicase DHX30 isoform X1 [Tribolium castaneum]|nr:PREDICTED: putative ATP-dependent RNA helicase DHX30 isoform X1 [Tribolium castaneum]|eukprot:XP_008195117.1 PREDICTED: putative ATP-dependent RNA helicase DHX30 isoform X1 [Tribolium castaneum]